MGTRKLDEPSNCYIGCSPCTARHAAAGHSRAGILPAADVNPLPTCEHVDGPAADGPANLQRGRQGIVHRCFHRRQVCCQLGAGTGAIRPVVGEGRGGSTLGGSKGWAGKELGWLGSRRKWSA